MVNESLEGLGDLRAKGKVQSLSQDSDPSDSDSDSDVASVKILCRC